MRLSNYFIASILFIYLLPNIFLFAALSCTVTDQSSCVGTTILRMSSSANAHGELPSQSNSNYSNNVVCCTAGSSSISNSCSGNYKIIGKLSNSTNAHFEEGISGSYVNNLCLSDSTDGDILNVGYQDTNCNGYDTTLFSISSSSNGTLGDSSAYTRKICGTIVPLVLSFSISSNSVGFGNLSVSSSRYANNTQTGNSTEVEAHTIQAGTNSSGGYIITLNGDTLTSGSDVINPIGNINTAPNVGTSQFGIRAVVNSGTGLVSSPYNGSGFALDLSGSSSQIAGGSGDGNDSIYSIRYLGNISAYTPSGEYKSNITYIMTSSF